MREMYTAMENIDFHTGINEGDFLKFKIIVEYMAKELESKAKYYAFEAKTVQAAWDNHFAAFGAQDVDKIMLDYTDQSVLKAWDHRT